METFFCRRYHDEIVMIHGCFPINARINGSIQQSMQGFMQPQSPYSQMSPINKFITSILFKPQDVACK